MQLCDKFSIILVSTSACDKTFWTNLMFYEVKSFCHIHEATVHIATIPDEVVDSLAETPGW